VLLYSSFRLPSLRVYFLSYGGFIIPWYRSSR